MHRRRGRVPTIVTAEAPDPVARCLRYLTAMSRSELRTDTRLVEVYDPITFERNFEPQLFAYWVTASDDAGDDADGGSARATHDEGLRE